jgi:hypothetical protein
MSTAMMAITTKSSISVNPCRRNERSMRPSLRHERCAIMPLRTWGMTREETFCPTREKPPPDRKGGRGVWRDRPANESRRLTCSEKNAPPGTTDYQKTRKGK